MHSMVESVVAPFTIASGSALSDAQHIGIGNPSAIALPAIDNAKITFQASVDGTTWYDVYDATNAEVEEPATTGQLYLDLPSALRGVEYLKLRTGTSSSPVSQSAERTIHVIIK